MREKWPFSRKHQYSYNLIQVRSKWLKKLFKKYQKKYKIPDRRKENNANSHGKKIIENTNQNRKNTRNRSVCTNKGSQRRLFKWKFFLFNKPLKRNTGKIRKVILGKINKQLQTKVSQWKNTSSVIEWINNFENKESLSFMAFDIKVFYPSASQN